MSVLINGMNMPKNCAMRERWSICECLKEYKDYESVLYAVDDGDLIRADGCPLVEIPTPYGDYVDRQAAIAAIDKEQKEIGVSDVSAMYAYSKCKAIIKQLPSAQPKKGKWISADAMFHGVPFYCSECGENTRDTVMGKPRWKFCPMCGAKMEGADDE